MYKTFTVREVRSKEQLERVTGFYEKNQNDFCMTRSMEQKLQSVSKRQTFYIENNDGDIVAAASTFNYFLQDSDGNNIDYAELGNCLVIDNSFNLQKILIAVRFLNNYFYESPSDGFFSLNYKRNLKSEKSLKSRQFKEWEAPNELQSLVKSKFTDVDFNDVVFYKSNSSHALNNAMYLNKLIKSGMIIKPGHHAFIEFDIPLYKYKNMLEDMAFRYTANIKR